MTTIAIVYHSLHGHTEVIAKELEKGALTVENVRVELIHLRAEDVNAGRWKDDRAFEAIEAADGIVLGCPTLMGSVSVVLKAFMEAAFEPWKVQKWKDKFATCFANSASQSGDKLNVVIQLAVFGAQMGMIWVPVGELPGNNWSGGTPNDDNRLGSWLGLMSQSNADQGPELTPSQGDRSTARRHGRRFAEIVRHWKREGEYRTERAAERP